MSWQTEMVTMLRVIINDNNSVKTFTDLRLQQMIVVAGIQVQRDIDLNTTYNISLAPTPTITPDPTSAPDKDFVSLVILKAACLIDISLFKTTAYIDNIGAKAGIAKMRTIKKSKAYKDILSLGVCNGYEKLKFKYKLKDIEAVWAVLSPFTNIEAAQEAIEMINYGEIAENIVGTGLYVSNDRLHVGVNHNISIVDNKLEVNENIVGENLTWNTGTKSIDMNLSDIAGSGIVTSSNMLNIDTGPGIEIESDKVRVKSTIAGNNLTWNEAQERIDFSGADVTNSFYNIEDYGAVEGADITDILQDAFNITNHRTTVYIPAKYYFISDTVSTPFIDGGTIMGAGAGLSGQEDNIYGGHFNYGTARLIWQGARDIPMLKIVGQHLIFMGGLTLIGKDQGVDDADRCSIGVLITKQAPTPDLGNGTINFNCLHLADFDTMFQCGQTLLENNSDQIYINRLSTSGKCNTVYKIVNQQGIFHTIDYLKNSATPCDRIFQVYGGGRVNVREGVVFSDTLLEIPSGASGIGSNNGLFTFDNIQVDQGSNSNFIAVNCLIPAPTMIVTMDNLFVQYDNYYANSDYAFNLYGGIAVSLTNPVNVQKGWFRCKKYGSAKPNVSIDRGAVHDIFYQDLTNPTGLFSPDTDGYYMTTRACHKFGAGTVEPVFTDGTITL